MYKGKVKTHVCNDMGRTDDSASHNIPQRNRKTANDKSLSLSTYNCKQQESKNKQKR